MVTHYGMSERLGLATYEAQPVSPLLEPTGIPERRNCSEHTAELIDGEVAAILEQPRERVETTLRQERPKLDALARLLLEREVVDRAALQALLAPAPQAAPAAPAMELA